MNDVSEMHWTNLERINVGAQILKKSWLSDKLVKLLNHPIKSIFALLVAGALTASALPPWYILPLLPIGLILPFIATFYTRRLKLLAWQAFAFGMGYHCFGLYWITYAILTRVAEFWWLVPFAVPFISLLIAPLLVIPVLGTRFLICIVLNKAPQGYQKRSFFFGAVLIFSGLYVLSDQMRMYIFTGFPWNPLGSVWEFPSVVGDFFIQPAAWIGVDGLSLLTVVIGLSLLLRGLPRLVACCIFFLWIIASWFHLTHSTFAPIPDGGLPKVGVIQTDVAETEILTDENERERFYKNLNSTRILSDEMNLHSSKKEGAHIILWPESAVHFPLEENTTAQRLMAEAGRGAWVVTGTERGEDESWYNSIQAVSPEGHVQLSYDKVRLVPFGEYQPGFIPVNLLPGQFHPGKMHHLWQEKGFANPSPLVCYETIFSGDVKPKKQQPGWLFSVSNDAWYAHSSGPFQHLQSVRIRSVEEGVPTVFVNNAGPSGAYDALGRSLLYIPSGKSQTAVIDIPQALEPTLFSKWGRKIPTFLSVLGMVIGFGCMSSRRCKAQKNN